MYEELGGSTIPSGNSEVASVNSASAAAAAAAATAAALAGNDYYQSYQSYPYGSSNYMSGFNYANNGSSSNYDRSSMYNPYNSPTAFVPHSAINLSVKPGENATPGQPAAILPDLPETAAASTNLTASYLGTNCFTGFQWCYHFSHFNEK